MVHDEEKAIEEIKKLSENAKMHLQDICRNFAHAIIIDNGFFQRARIKKFIEDLEEMGL